MPFKKGYTPWNYGHMEEKSMWWKGDGVGYGGIHHWIERQCGKAKICSTCGSKNNVQWANKSHEYKRDIDDWLELCQVCHWKYDGFTKLEKNDVPNIKKMYAEGKTQTKLAAEYGVSQTTISNLLHGKTKFYA